MITAGSRPSAVGAKLVHTTSVTEFIGSLPMKVLKPGSSPVWPKRLPNFAIPKPYEAPSGLSGFVGSDGLKPLLLQFRRQELSVDEGLTESLQVSGRGDPRTRCPCPRRIDVSDVVGGERASDGFLLHVLRKCGIRHGQDVVPEEVALGMWFREYCSTQCPGTLFPSCPAARRCVP